MLLIVNLLLILEICSMSNKFEIYLNILCRDDYDSLRLSELPDIDPNINLSMFIDETSSHLMIAALFDANKCFSALLPLHCHIHSQKNRNIVHFLYATNKIDLIPLVHPIRPDLFNELDADGLTPVAFCHTFEPFEQYASYNHEIDPLSLDEFFCRSGMQNRVELPLKLPFPDKLNEPRFIYNCCLARNTYVLRYLVEQNIQPTGSLTLAQIVIFGRFQSFTVKFLNQLWSSHSDLITMFYSYITSDLNLDISIFFELPL
jgi:hypothetical protein